MFIMYVRMYVSVYVNCTIFFVDYICLKLEHKLGYEKVTSFYDLPHRVQQYLQKQLVPTL